MVLADIQSDIEAFRADIMLYEEVNFISRTEAIDDIDFHIIDRIDQLLGSPNPPDELYILKEQANGLKIRLEEINDNLFKRIRTNIQSGIYRGANLRQELGKYRKKIESGDQLDAMDYDNLDLLVNGIFPVQELPEETKERDEEMVFYQKTPARIIFELAERAHFSETDIFYDLGSGLGQVSILVNLLTGVMSKGVEFEPEFCKYASACAAELNLKNIAFINADARSVDYSNGTVFFMYTPFTGKILDDVLNRLKELSQRKIIRLFTYGPCSLEVEKQNWLIPTSPGSMEIYKLTEFRSRFIY